MTDAIPILDFKVVYDANGNVHSVIMKKETFVAHLVTYIEQHKDTNLPDKLNELQEETDSTPPKVHKPNEILNNLHEQLYELQGDTGSTLSKVKDGIPHEVLSNIADQVFHDAHTTLASKLFSARKCFFAQGGSCNPIGHLSNEQQKVAHMCISRVKANTTKAVKRAAFDPIYIKQLQKKAHSDARRQRNKHYRLDPPETISRLDLPKFPRAVLSRKEKARLNANLKRNDRMRSDVRDKDNQPYFPCWRRVHRENAKAYEEMMRTSPDPGEAILEHFNLALKPSRWETETLLQTPAAEIELLAPGPEKEERLQLFLSMLSRLGFGRVYRKGEPTVREPDPEAPRAWRASLK